MSVPLSARPILPGKIYFKDALIKGQPSQIECVDLLGQTYAITRGLLTVIGLEDDWYEDQQDPAAVIAALKEHPEIKADIFTFWQRYPDLEPKYDYPMEGVEIAALPIQSFDDWFNHKIKSRIRNLIRKSEKEGIVVKETAYDDEFVRGMTAIFNEAPIRQGRKFWHYGKDFDTVKAQFARYIHREYMIGAYYQGEMIGLIMLGNAGKFGLTGQIISSLKHRDKATNNALVSKAVEVCEQRKLGSLVYLFWSDDSLAEFKRRCGFEKVTAQRYYVPLTTKGTLGLKLNAHRGLKAMIPEKVKTQLKRIRRMWHGRKDE